MGRGSGRAAGRRASGDHDRARRGLRAAHCATHATRRRLGAAPRCAGYVGSDLVLVLVIDTSSEAVTAAVVEVRDGRILPPPVEEATINARGHGELLAPEIQRALDYRGA